MQIETEDLGRALAVAPPESAPALRDALRAQLGAPGALPAALDGAALPRHDPRPYGVPWRLRRDMEGPVDAAADMIAGVALVMDGAAGTLLINGAHVFWLAPGAPPRGWFVRGEADAWAVACALGPALHGARSRVHFW